MIRIPTWIALSLAVVLTLPVGVRAQDAREDDERQAKPEKNGPAEPMVVKVYQVLDLVTRAPNYPYEGNYLPAMRETKAGANLLFIPSQDAPADAGGGMGGGAGGGMGGMGGGMFQIPTNVTPPAPTTLSQRGARGNMGGANSAASGRRSTNMRELIETITDVVEPTSWVQVGGDGNISSVGSALVISQSAAAHAQIKDLLEQLRHEGGTFQSLTIGAEWLVLSKAQLAELKTPVDRKKPSASGRSLNREALDKLPEATRRHAGQITCFNGQTVYIVSGRMETTIQGGIPVVGQGTASYQAVLLTPQMGSLLQVTASVLPGDAGVLLDLHSSVTRGDEPGKSVTFQAAGAGDEDEVPVVQIDRLNVATQQFATSVRMPLGEPVLVGGMTFPGRGPGAAPEQLYLIIEVEAGK